MIRRSVFATGALVAALALSSCSTFSANDDAASIDGHHLTQDDLQLMLESDLGQSLLNNQPVDGVIDAGSARGLINAWLQLTAFTDAGLGADVDTTDIEKNLQESTPSWDAAPQVMRDLAIKNIAIGTLLQNGDIDRTSAEKILTDADIAVDSRYGRWDGEVFSVVAFD